MDALRDLLPILVGVAMALTLLALFAGIFAMSRGGAFNARYGNLLMRARVILQAVAVLLFALILLLAMR